MMSGYSWHFKTLCNSLNPKILPTQSNKLTTLHVYVLTIHTQRQVDCWPLTRHSILSLMCIQTGIHPQFQISKVSKPQENRWLKTHHVQCILVKWLVSAMHNVWFYPQMKQAAVHLCCSQTLSSQTHFPVHVPYALFPKTIQQLPEWQSFNLQQFRGGQTDGPVTGGGGRIQTQGRRGRGMIVRRRGKAKERVAFRLGVGSEGEAAVHTEMRLCERVWAHFH